MIYETNVIMGSKLSKMVEQVKHLERRTACERVKKFIYGKDYTRVCAVYGLQSTGKRTVMLQAIADMSEEEFARTAYIKAKDTDTIQDVADDVHLLDKIGVEYVFVDEITCIKDFIDGAALLSDIYAMMGMKIVLTGTGSPAISSAFLPTVFGFRVGLISKSSGSSASRLQTASASLKNTILPSTSLKQI